MNNQARHNSVSRRGSAHERDIVGIARVILPPKMDRDEYIQHCYQCATISILSRVNLDVVHDVNVDVNVLQKISFPETEDKLGSTVVWVNIPIYDRPIIVAILNNSDEMSEQVEENEFYFSRFNEEGQVSISGKARGGQIDIIAQTNEGTGGRLSINVSNKAGTAKFDVVVNGDFFMKANSAELNYRDSYELNINDGKSDTKSTFLKMDTDIVESRVQESTSGLKFGKDTFEVGDGGESAALAKELESFMHSLIDVIASQTVVTSMGPQPLVNATGISAMKGKTTKWISSYLKIQ